MIYSLFSGTYEPLGGLSAADRILKGPEIKAGFPLTQTCARCGAQAVVKLVSEPGYPDACYCNACHMIGTRLLAKAMALGIDYKAMGTEAPRWTHPDSTPDRSAEILARRMDRLTRWLALCFIPLLTLIVVRNLPGLRDLPWWP